jgi:hypothetical protein
VNSIDSPVFGSESKLSITQFSLLGVPPELTADGYTTCGPLLVRSVVTTSRAPIGEPFWLAAAACRHATEVAQAWAMSGPEIVPRPSRAARLGAP